MAWRVSIVKGRDEGSDRSMEGKRRSFVSHVNFPKVQKS